VVEEMDEADDALTAVVNDDTDGASDDADETPDTGHLAPVVALFAGELNLPVRPEPPAPPSAPTAQETADEAAPGGSVDEAPRSSIDDLFARLRASRAGAVAQRAMADHPSTTPAAPLLELVPDLVEVAINAPTNASATAPAAPADGDGEVELALDDTPFARRDAELTPLIVVCARKLKRVLADEQNDMLLVLRRKDPVVALSALLPTAADHLQRYAAAIDDELHHAALAGAASVDDASLVEHQRQIDRQRALTPAVDSLDASVVAALRDRVDRAVVAASGENTVLAESVKAIYREWKTQRIDEHLDDVVRMAFGRGALAALAPGTPICWTIDPHGPECADAEDNTLGGVIGAGQPFPTDHLCAPAHEGCRCMLQRAPL
ncbi:MAG: hypothetical protein WCK21_04620, partial [Actinomycetota bacterium]